MVYVFLANGFEEIEALTPVDLLRRAGIEVKTIAVAEQLVLGAHNIPVLADGTRFDVELNDGLEAVILPGGMPGTKNLERNETVQKALAYMNAKGRLICAICAAPSILGHAGLLQGKKATCFPGFETELDGADVLDIPAIRDGNIITSRGAGTAIEFSREIIAYLKDEETADSIVAAIQKK